MNSTASRSSSKNLVGSLPAGSPDRLAARIDRFCQELLTDFASRVKSHPKGFRTRVLALVRKRLPPFKKPAGRPKSDRVTLATEIYQGQRLEIAQQGRSRIDWLAIARQADPSFVTIKTEYRRRVVLKRLRDAVYVRVRARMCRPALDPALDLAAPSAKR